MIAAAVLGDAEKVEMVDLETADRFTALQSGEVDVLSATPPGPPPAMVPKAPPSSADFYDGQGIMVGTDSGFASIADLDGVIVCVAQGTTTEGNAAAEAPASVSTGKCVRSRIVDLIQEAFIAGQCDGWSSDPASSPACGSDLPRRTRRADDPARGLLQGAARSGSRRR